jgi:hypothetical protein
VPLEVLHNQPISVYNSESLMTLEPSGDEVAAEDRPLRFVKTNNEQAAHLVADARASPRYAITQAIRFTRKGHAPAPALLVNLSEGGALARIKVRAPEEAIVPPWPLRLSHGDELWMVDLIELPLPCWLIETGVGLIRVHIYHDRRTHEPLQALIARLAATCQRHRAEANPTPAGHPGAEKAALTSGGSWII